MAQLARETAVLNMSVHKFIRDESGGYTIWSLIWFSLYVAMGGLAVDVTDAYRNQTLLQSTADASALAAVMSLPNQNNAVAQAVAYSTDNMDQTINGDVLDNAEVIFGNWDFDTGAFTPGTTDPDAVRVVTRRDASNGNPLATNFLRIIGLQQWNVSVDAIAVKYVSECLTDGFVAENTVDMRSNNAFYNDICIHGQNLIEDGGQDNAVDLQGGNYYEPGVTVSVPDLDGLPDRSSIYSQNIGLEEATVEGDLWPKDVDNVNNIIDGLRNLDPDYLPDFMVNIGTDGVRTMAAGVTKVTGSSLPGTLVANTVYELNCNGQYTLPGVAMTQIVIVADCRIHNSNGLVLEDAVLATSYDGANASIQIAAQSTIGRPDTCTAGGGVEIYTPGDISIAAQGEWNGLRVVSGSNVEFSSQNVGIKGISVQAKNSIDMSSNNDFGLCTGGVPGQFASQYRLVR